MLLLALACARPPAADPSGARAADDVRLLADYIRDVHPDPYRFISAEAFDRLAEQTAAHLAATPGPDPLQIGRAFHTLLAPLGDDHIEVALPLYQQTDTPLSLLPVLPIQAGGRTFVDASAGDLPVGTELVAIDGVEMAALYDELMPLVLAAGEIPAAHMALLESDFARHYHLGRGMRSTYTVTVRRPDAEPEDLTLTGLSRAEFGQMQQQRRSAPRWGTAGGDPLPVLINGNILRIPTFGVADMDAFRARVDALFETLGDADALVIDLRGNVGGLRPNTFAVLDHLLSEPYAQWESATARVDRIPRPYTGVISFPFGGSKDGLKQRLPDGLTIEGDPLASWTEPSPAPFDGEVTVWVDGLTASAATELLIALKKHRPAAQIRGTEPGGECAQHIGELPTLFTAPETGVMVLVSVLRLEHVAVEGCTRGRGQQPDQPVTYTEADFLAGRDPYRE